MSHLKAVALAAFFVASVALGQAIEEKVLIPIAVSDGTAANGSVWASDIWAYNPADRPIAARFPSHCPIGCGNGVAFPAGESIEVFLTPASIGRPGRVMFFAKGEAKVIKMGSFLLQEGSVNPYVWIPPVYESDLFTGVAQLVNIPTLDRYRLRLRIYSPDFMSRGTFRVRIYSMDSLVLLFDGSVSMTPGDSEFSPAYAEFSDFPVSDVPIRVQIDPDDPEIRYWPFISVTSNATDAATIVLPSHQ
jgi:hypothetical protein